MTRIRFDIEWALYQYVGKRHGWVWISGALKGTAAVDIDHHW